MLRISKSILAAARGSIGGRDDLIPGQECNKRKRSSRLSSAAIAQKRQRRGFRGSAGLTKAQKGQRRGSRRPAGLMQAQPGQRRGSVTQYGVTQALLEQRRG